MKIKSKKQGFIQIPILIIALVLAGSFATIGNNYSEKYKQSPISNKKENKGEKTKVEKDFSIATTTDDTTLEQRSYTLAEIKAENVKTKTSGFIADTKQADITDFTKLIDRANEQIKLLEQDKLNFQLLRETVDGHQKKSVDYAIEAMNNWADFAEQSVTRVPSEYQQSIRLTKDRITTDREYVVDTIKSNYAIVDLYFIDTSRNKKNIDSIISTQEELGDCIKLWSSETGDLSCQFSLDFISTTRERYVKDFRDIIEKLSKTDDYVFELVNNHTKSAEDTIVADLERISRMVVNMSSLRADLSQIEQKAQQDISQPIFGTSVKCYTSTNDSIFEKNRTYSTRCEPYTQTTAQRCATAMAARLASGIYDSQSDPECK